MDQMTDRVTAEEASPQPHAVDRTDRERRRAVGLRPGMTLVEIMIVLTIMAGIMAFAAYSVVGYLKSSKIKDAEAEVNQLRGFIDTFRVMHDRLPDSLDELAEEVDGLGKVTNDVPDDPWGNTYEYSNGNDGNFTLYSMGPDGQSSTTDDIYPEGMESEF